MYAPHEGYNLRVPKLQHYYGLNHLHYLTGSTYRRARLFDSERFRNQWVPQAHRWLSIAFTVAVIVNGVAVEQKKYTFWVGLLALLPLALLLFTGLYLFVLPYSTNWRSGRRTD
jgi:hypothetical protein